MDAERLHIESLHLRVPGLTAEEGRRLGEEVARRLGDEVARRMGGGVPERATPLHLGALDLRLTLPRRLSRDRLAEEIAMAILERLA